MNSDLNGIEKREIKKEDTIDIAKFLSKIFTYNTVEEWTLHLKNLWENNPVFQLNGDRGVMLMLNDRIIGFLAKFPTKMQLDGKEIVVACASNLAVHKDFRRRGLATRLRMEYSEQSKNTMMLATTPGKHTLKINANVGFKPLYNNVDNDCEVDSVVILNSMMASGLIPVVNKLPKLLRLPVSTSIKLVNKWQTRKISEITANTDYRIVHLDKADKSFDELWENTRHYYMMTNVRTSDVINWYLKLNQSSLKSLYGCYHNDELVGYMLVADMKIRNVDLKYCVDFWFNKGYDHVMTSILHFLKNRFANNRFGGIVLPHFNKDLSETLTNIGLLKVKGKKLMNFYSAPEKITQKINENNCYIVYMQSDRGIS